MKKRIVIILLVLFILPQIVYAIGLSPPSHLANMVYGKSQTFQFYAVNTMNYPMNIEVGIGSEYLSEYITLDNNLLYVKPNEWKPFTIKINYPAEPVKPGIHEIGISVTEQRKEEGMITVRASVSGDIYLREAYPGLYAEANLKTQDKNINETVPMQVILHNYGISTINNAGGYIDIYFNEEKVKTLELSQVNNITTFASKTMYAEFDTTGFKPGQYKANATINYDSKTINIKDEFKIGILQIDIIDFTKTAQQNRINPFEITIRSRWNEPINNVYADVNVKENGSVVESFRTISEDLGKWGQKKILGYFGAEGLSLGMHDAEINLKYKGIITTETGKINITEETKPVLEQPKSSIFSAYAVALIAVLIAIIIFLILSRRIKSGEKEIRTYPNF